MSATGATDETRFPAVSRAGALLATMRIANLPSVVSNVWLGIALAAFFWGPWHPGLLAPKAPELAALLIAALCLYLCGGFLNDWHDRAWDAKHRPERALPAGLFGSRAYLGIAVALAVAGLVCSVIAGAQTLPVFVAILALVVIYTWTHKSRPAAVLAVPACRALLVWAGYLLCAGPGLWEGFKAEFGGGNDRLTTLFHCCSALAFPLTHSVGVFAYVLGLSLFARHEATGHPSHGTAVVARALLWLPLAAMSAWWIPHYPLAGAAALVPFAAWTTLCLTVFRRPLPRLVSALLAGIPLVDFIAALPLATALVLPGDSVFDDPLLSITLVLPLATFALARLLQHFAPAT